MLIKKILFLAVFCFFTSCRWFSDADLSYIAGTNLPIPPGTPAFKLGYKHGCEQLFYSRGNGLYRSRYSYNYDPKLNGNTEYRFGYARGKSFCFNYVIQGSSGPVGGSDLYLFPNKDANGFVSGGIAAANYDSTAAGMFDGWGGPVDSGGFDGIYVGVLQNAGSGAVFTANPLWAGGSTGQFFGQ